MAPYVIPGIARFIAKLCPVFLALSFLGLLAILVLFAIAAVWRRSRRWTSQLVLLITFVWFITIWLSAANSLYHIWGKRGLLGGLLLFVVGVIPVSGLAMMVNAHWIELVYLVGAIITFSAVRAFASKVGEHSRYILEDAYVPNTKAHRRGA